VNAPMMFSNQLKTNTNNYHSTGLKLDEKRRIARNQRINDEIYTEKREKRKNSTYDATDVAVIIVSLVIIFLSK
jgi:hypothetical protein